VIPRVHPSDKRLISHLPITWRTGRLGLVDSPQLVSVTVASSSRSMGGNIWACLNYLEDHPS
jgi:hypothetical protein